MEPHDIQFMKDAITWASGCNPVKKTIPKVGAIIAVDNKVIGQGRRGTGVDGDDHHAEWDAINRVDAKNKPMLARATLYTTLEPCTRGVRSNPLECCTELIIQHQIQKVFIGILDPNQGVTGKGLWRLQDTGKEVALFPHDLSKQIRIQNAEFIRSQQELGVTILSPKNGEELRTYASRGKYTVRFKSLNPPSADTYLLIYRGGVYWPQPGLFRESGDGVWEIDAHFGTTGEHVLQLVTASDLGSVLIRYYRKVTELNRSRREKLRGKIDLSLLGGDFPGIEMNGLPKGIRLEGMVDVFVAYKVNVIDMSADPATVSRGRTLKLTYKIESSESVSEGIWLGASFQDKSGKYYFNLHEDKPISLTKGVGTYDRNFTIPRDAPLGERMLTSNVWRGVVSRSDLSRVIARGTPVPITIRE